MANSDASAAFDRARSFWESQFVDPLNVVIDADLASLASNVLGETSVFGIQQFGDDGFNGVVDRMASDQRAQVGSGDITDQLPNAAQASFLVFGFPPFIDFSIGGVSLSTANGKALGIPGIAPDQTDATITFSSNFSFDFDRSDDIAPGTFDFEGIAIHEIGHAVGFVSEVDTADFLMATSDLPFSGTLFPTPLDSLPTVPGRWRHRFHWKPPHHEPQLLRSVRRTGELLRAGTGVPDVRGGCLWRWRAGESLEGRLGDRDHGSYVRAR